MSMRLSERLEQAGMNSAESIREVIASVFKRTEKIAEKNKRSELTFYFRYAIIIIQDHGKEMFPVCGEFRV